MTYSGLVGEIINLINTIIPAIFAVVFVYFMWKMIDSWILHAGDPAKITEGKQYAIGAIITFVVMISAWGIVSMIQNSLF